MTGAYNTGKTWVMPKVDESALESFMTPARLQRLRDAAGQRTSNLRVVLDGVHDPHNLSAVVRSCDGFGLMDLHAIESQKRFSCRRKVSQGAEKWLQIHRHPDAASCILALQQAGFEIWVADPRPGSKVVDDLPWERRMALVFGNEHQGASAEMLRAAHGLFFIPMYGLGESFNISVATGITLAIAVRERLRRIGTHGDLSTKDQNALISLWQRRAVKHADRILDHLEKSGRQKEGGTDGNP